MVIIRIEWLGLFLVLIGMGAGGVIMIVVSRNAKKRSDKPLLKWLWQN